MAERVRWTAHKGKQVLYIDYSGLRGEEFLPVINKVPPFYAGQPDNTVLCLTDVRNAFGNEQVVEALKRISKQMKRFERKSAVIGVTGIKGVLLMAVNLFSGQSIKSFDSEEQALDWLVA